MPKTHLVIHKVAPKEHEAIQHRLHVPLTTLALARRSTLGDFGVQVYSQLAPHRRFPVGVEVVESGNLPAAHAESTIATRRKRGEREGGDP